MRSTQPLSEQDIKVLKDLKVLDKGLVVLGLFFGPLFATIGTLMLMPSSGQPSVIVVLIALASWGAGCLAVAGSIWQYMKNREHNLKPLHGNGDRFLVHIPQTGPQAGDRVIIQYMLKKDSTEALINMNI